VFDIAKIESTNTENTREVHSLDGEKYYSLFPEYATDGGHLIKKGRDLVARKLIKFTAESPLK